MTVSLPLASMSTKDKLAVMEALWADLSSDEAELRSPTWHKVALQEAEQSVAKGKAKFSDWGSAKERIRRKAARLP